MTSQRPPEDPFDLRDHRAMVSLGPLSSNKYCSYSCPFCYVRVGFLSYASLSIADIMKWLRDRRDRFDIVYVSGDTDSFAPPRTSQGIDLLRSLLELRVDILFTTRAIFSSGQLDELGRLATRLKRRGRLMFGCVSVAQLSFPRLEPSPIAPPAQRLAQLGELRKRGVISSLALRPFLPTVPIEEYVTMVDLALGKVDAVLGGVWYVDGAGVLERAVLKGSLPGSPIPYSEAKMDFDANDATWNVFQGTDIQEAVRARCEALSLPFFMRSRPAVEWFRRTSGYRESRGYGDEPKC